MDLSIVIVNYNVSFFLAQCLDAVLKASENLMVEVFVVDNNSEDDSCEMVKNHFKWVKLIENKTNVGFSKANNQAINEASGKYILLLNPDTVIKEDTLDKCFRFMENHSEAGALGVKMIDGKGHFLPESKRSLPTPSVAFYKIFGLSSLFPKSKKFGKYHLSFLDKNENHQIEILSGAFMFMRNETLSKTGLLDETYFMYGEDIDLSYRIIKAGYKNYYLADTSIIHYKGESTKKGSLNYVFVFYRAMIIFAKNHFTKQSANLYSLVINLAIYLRATLAILRRLFTSLFVPATDLLLIAVLFFYLQSWYSSYSGKVFPAKLIFWGYSIFPWLWVFSLTITGGYDQPFQRKYINRGGLLATFLIVFIYALLSEDYRFSRVVMLSSILGSWLYLFISRSLFNTLPFSYFKLAKTTKKRIAIVALPNEKNEIANLLQSTSRLKPKIFFVSPTANKKMGEQYLGSCKELKEIQKAFKINEVVFSSKTMKFNEIVEAIEHYSSLNLEFKIATADRNFIIGSNSINTSGEYYTLLNFNNLISSTSKRNKRLFDVFSSFTLLILFPFVMIFQAKRKAALKNIYKVLFGQKSWVGFGKTHEKQTYLPKIKKGVFAPHQISATPVLSEQEIIDKNLGYAKNFRVSTDLKILLNNLTNLSNS